MGRVQYRKSVQCFCAVGHVKNGSYIADQFGRVIEEVGLRQVVVVSTDNAPNCKAAGEILQVCSLLEI